MLQHHPAPEADRGHADQCARDNSLLTLHYFVCIIVWSVYIYRPSTISSCLVSTSDWVFHIFLTPSPAHQHRVTNSIYVIYMIVCCIVQLYTGTSLPHKCAHTIIPPPRPQYHWYHLYLAALLLYRRTRKGGNARRPVYIYICIRIRCRMSVSCDAALTTLYIPD